MRRFKKVYLEITNVCNLSCSFCSISSRPDKFMSLLEFEHIIKELKPYCNYLYLHVKGEPLLHPDLAAMLDLCAEHGFLVNITTNGTLINQVKEILLSKPAVRLINFSMHSFENSSDIAGLTTYLKPITDFAKTALAQTPMFISFRLWNLTRDNQLNIQQQKNRAVLEFIEKEFNLNYKLQENITTGKEPTLQKRLFLNCESEFRWPDLQDAEITANGFCYGLRQHVAILVDGTVTPCCLDGEGVLNLGNILKEPFAEILHNPRAESIYKGFSQNRAVEELCRKCETLQKK